MHKFSLIYAFIATLLCLVLGGSLNACQAKPDDTQATQQEEPIALEVVAYNPCKDPLLYLERGLESRQRQKQCG